MTFKWILEKFHKCPPPEVREIKVSCHKYGDWPHGFVAVDKDMIKEIRDMAPPELKSHRAEISKIYDTKAFHRELESMVDQQVYFLAEKARDERQLDFGRGTINGIRLVQERFEDLHAGHLEDKKPPEEFSPYELIPKT